MSIIVVPGRLSLETPSLNECKSEWMNEWIIKSLFKGVCLKELSPYYIKLNVCLLVYDLYTFGKGT